MAFAQGTITRQSFVVGDDEYLICKWTDTEAGAATEGSVPELPILCRLMQYKATASASTINPRFTSASAAAAGSHDDLGTCATTAIQINEELNALMTLAASSTSDRTGTMYYKDQVASGTATVQHTAVFKAGA